MDNPTDYNQTVKAGSLSIHKDESTGNYSIQFRKNGVALTLNPDYPLTTFTMAKAYAGLLINALELV